MSDFLKRRAQIDQANLTVRERIRYCCSRDDMSPRFEITQGSELAATLARSFSVQPQRLDGGLVNRSGNNQALVTLEIQKSSAGFYAQ